MFDEIACSGGIDVELSVRLCVEPWFGVGDGVGLRGYGRVWRCRELTTSPPRVVEDGGKGLVYSMVPALLLIGWI